MHIWCICRLCEYRAWSDSRAPVSLHFTLRRAQELLRTQLSWLIWVLFVFKSCLFLKVWNRIYDPGLFFPFFSFFRGRRLIQVKKTFIYIFIDIYFLIYRNLLESDVAPIHQMKIKRKDKRYVLFLHLSRNMAQ